MFRLEEAGGGFRLDFTGDRNGWTSLPKGKRQIVDDIGFTYTGVGEEPETDLPVIWLNPHEAVQLVIVRGRRFVCQVGIPGFDQKTPLHMRPATEKEAIRMAARAIFPQSPAQTSQPTQVHLR